MKTLVCSVQGAIRREYFSPATTDDRREFLTDHWDATDIAEVMDIVRDREVGEYTFREFHFSDGTLGAVRVKTEDLYWEPELTAEDYAEWCSASCGVGYYTYIGKPWLD